MKRRVPTNGGIDEQTHAAATKKWWEKLIWAEVFPLIMMFPAVLLLASGDKGTSESLSRLGYAGDFLASLFRWEQELDQAEQSVSGWVVLGVFATAGIAATVALNSALDRVERLHAAFRPEPAGNKDVFAVRHAEMSQGAALMIGLFALTFSHVVLLSAVVSVIDGRTRGPAAAGAVMAAFLALFFLLECTRLAAPATSQLKIVPDNPVPKSFERLNRAAQKAGEASGAWRSVISGAWAVAITGLLLWTVFPSFLGYGDGATSRAPALVFAAVLVFILIAILAGRLADTATFEKGVTRIASLVMAVSMLVAGWLACISAMAAGLAASDVWRGGWAQAAGILLIAVIVGVTELFRVLGTAQIGPFRALGLRSVAIAGRPMRRVRRPWAAVASLLIALIVIAGLSALAAGWGFGKATGLFFIALLATWSGLRTGRGECDLRGVFLAAAIIAIGLSNVRAGAPLFAVLPWSAVCLAFLSSRLWRRFSWTRACADHVFSLEIRHSRRRIAAALDAHDATDEPRENSARHADARLWDLSRQMRNEVG